MVTAKQMAVSKHLLQPAAIAKSVLTPHLPVIPNLQGETASDAKPADSDKVKDEKLTGRASQLQTLPQPNIPLIKLRGPQLQASDETVQ